eukprot:1669941-Amphidinium_carterae.1
MRPKEPIRALALAAGFAMKFCLSNKTHQRLNEKQSTNATVTQRSTMLPLRLYETGGALSSESCPGCASEGEKVAAGQDSCFLLVASEHALDLLSDYSSSSTNFRRQAQLVLSDDKQQYSEHVCFWIQTKTDAPTDPNSCNQSLGVLLPGKMKSNMGIGMPRASFGGQITVLQ